MAQTANKAPRAPLREDYPWRFAMPTRWMDNDIYGHVNNVAYYSYFDTAANRFLIENGGLDIHRGDIVGFVVESQCNYHAPVAFPDELEAGVRVDRLGSRSVTYGMAIFAAERETACAHGHFVHVFVDRASQRAVAIPPAIRDALERISRTSATDDGLQSG